MEASNSQKTTTNPNDTNINQEERDLFIGQLFFYIYMMGFVGTPYRWGGDDTIGGYDCSGITQEFLAYHGLNPSKDMTANELWKRFSDGKNGVFVKKPCLGCLAVYGTKEKATHIMTFVNEFQVIGATGGGRNTLSPVDAERDNAFVKVRPWNYRSDFLGAYKPLGLPW